MEKSIFYGLILKAYFAQNFLKETNRIEPNKREFKNYQYCKVCSIYKSTENYIKRYSTAKLVNTEHIEIYIISYN